jgi:hypothetical protein
MSETKFPANWNEQKVRRVLGHYEGQTEVDAVAEDEASIRPSTISGRAFLSRSSKCAINAAIFDFEKTRASKTSRPAQRSSSRYARH